MSLINVAETFLNTYPHVRVIVYQEYFLDDSSCCLIMMVNNPAK